MKLSMSLELWAEVGLRWALALWMCRGSRFSVWGSSGRRGAVLGRGTSALLEPGCGSSRDLHRGQDFGGESFQTWPGLQPAPWGGDCKAPISWRVKGAGQRVVAAASGSSTRAKWPSEQQGVTWGVAGVGMSPVVPWEDAPAPALLGLPPSTAGRAPRLAWGLLFLPHPEPFHGKPTPCASVPLLNTWMQHPHCHSKH